MKNFSLFIIVVVFCAWMVSSSVAAEKEIQSVEIPFDPKAGSTGSSGIEFLLSQQSPNINSAALQLFNQVGGSVYAFAINGDLGFMGIGPRLAGVDLKNPAKPQILGVSDALGLSVIKQIVLQGNFAFVVDGNGQICIFDVSYPSAPIKVWMGQSYIAKRIAVKGNYLYSVADYSTSSSQFKIFNITNPRSPVEMGVLTMAATNVFALENPNFVVASVDNSTVVLDVSNPSSPKQTASIGAPAIDFASYGNYLYVVGSNVVVNIADPTQPAVIGRVGNLSYGYQAIVKGDSLFLLSNSSDYYDLSVYSLTNPATPSLIGRYFNDYSSIIGGLSIKDSVLYINKGFYGVQMIDISDTSHLVNLRNMDFCADVTKVWATRNAVFANCGLRAYTRNELSPPRLLGDFGVQVNDFVLDRNNVWLSGNKNILLMGLDQSNPSYVSVLGSVKSKTDCCTSNNIAKSGNRVYVSVGNQIQIYDVSNPVSPTILGAYTAASDVLSLASFGNYLMAGVNYAYSYPAYIPANVQIIDASTAGSPRVVYTTTSLNSKFFMVVSGTVGYFDDGYLKAIDLSNPQSPIISSSLGFAASYALAIDKNILYAGLYGGSVLGVYDISSATAPKLVTYQVCDCEITNITVEDSQLFLATKELGVLYMRWADKVDANLSPYSTNIITATSQPLTLTVPGSIFPDWNIRLRLASPSDSNLSGGTRFLEAGDRFDIYATGASGNSLSPSSPYTIEILYNPAQLIGSFPSTIGLYWWDEMQWQKQDTNVDLSQHIIRSQTTKMGTFAVLGQTAPVFLPMTMRSSTIFIPDVTLTAMEVTQGIQGLDNHVPLVEHRPTVVRGYARLKDPVVLLRGVNAQLEGKRNEVALPGSPLKANMANVADVVDRGVAERSFAFYLPESWLQGTITLKLTVDPENLLKDANQGDNTTETTISFNSMPALNIKLVPISYTHQPAGKTVPAPTTDGISEWVLNSYPINILNVSIHAPVAFVGDLSQNNDWGRLLNSIYALKQAEGAPASQVYYGWIPISDTLYSPAWGGMGYLRPRASIGLDGNGEILAHEVGHNFGLPHAPCGNPGGLDPNYPYQNASIGEYGYSVSSNSLVEAVYSPSTYKDTMSYCYPRWFSDYNYRKLYDDQRAHGQAAADIPPINGLLVRANVSISRGVDVLPSYYLSAPVFLSSTTESDYVVELVGEQDNLISSHPVKAYKIEDGEENTYDINEIIPVSAASVKQLRIKFQGKPIAKRDIAQSNLLVLDASKIQDHLALNAGLPDVPRLVRYTEDNGTTWTVLGIDLTADQMNFPIQQLPNSAIYEVIFADGYGSASIKWSK